MDRMPRALTPEEIDILKILANQAMTLLELRHERNWLKQLLAELDRIYKTLRESEQRWSFALEGSGDGVWDWQVDTDEVFFSKRWKAMLGYAEHEFPNSYEAWYGIVHPQDIAETMARLRAHLNGDAEGYRIEYRIRRKDGEWLWVLTRGLVVERDKSGKPLRMVGTHTDISQRKQSEDLIWRQANFDALTGLPNRRMFFDRLSQEIARATRGRQMFAVLFIDLDGFKQVNDALGHRAGDELLVEVGHRLGECIRKSDTLARLGGDEFIVILSSLKQQSSVERIADKILKAMSRPFNLGGKQAEVSASIGISMFPVHGLGGDSLISHADTAMYDAKEIGKNCWVIYAPRPAESDQAG
jgi:diguanylate cyclase (GGDEF)-like protein/PAS domain S-box-containing protein